jgi:hypothetical protein
LKTRNAGKPNPIPFQFVLEQLEKRSPIVRPMFGCHAVYIGEKIVLMLRNKQDEAYDNGVWVATDATHHGSLNAHFPSMQSIRLFGSKVSAWQNIPVAAPDFEESVSAICDLILKNDPRIGKIPKSKKQS